MSSYSIHSMEWNGIKAVLIPLFSGLMLVVSILYPIDCIKYIEINYVHDLWIRTFTYSVEFPFYSYFNSFK